MTHVTALIVNYKAAGLVLDNLPNLTAAMQGVNALDIVLVENGSPGDDLQVLRAGIEAQGATDRCELVEAGVNGGFAAGNNVGFRTIAKREAQPDYVVLINPDTRFHEGSLKALVEAAEANPRAGGLGGYATNEEGERRGCAYRFPSLGRELSKLPLMYRLFPERIRDINVIAPTDDPIPCDWVSGSCFLIRREALEIEPLFDDNYFLYFEETDYCRRLNEAGYGIMHVPSARYVHIKGVSTGIKDGKAEVGPLPDYWYNSWRRYFVKNHGRVYSVATGLAMMAAVWLNRLRGRPPAPGSMTEGRFMDLVIKPTLKGSPL